jgi:hypothetical protein
MRITEKSLCGASRAFDVFRGNGRKVFVLFTAAVSLAGCEALYGTPNVYKLPIARAYQKLMAFDIKPSGKGPFGRLQIETSGIRNRTVEWAVKGNTAEPICVATLKSQEGDQTRVDVSCKNGGEGPAAGIYAKMARNCVIELVDAALKDRPYDPKKADEGATAALWPADVIDHGNLATASAKALEMDRQVAEDMRQIRNSR